MGLEPAGEEGRRFRFTTGGDGPGGRVDLLCSPDAGHGRVAAGSVHHVAWRVPDEASQLAWRERLVEAGLDVTPVLDRQYFRSIYFREPGGVLFEFATDSPGFGLDESRDSLGTELKLPPWLESRRTKIEAALPRLEDPSRPGPGGAPR